MAHTGNARDASRKLTTAPGAWLAASRGPSGGTWSAGSGCVCCGGRRPRMRTTAHLSSSPTGPEGWDSEWPAHLRAGKSQRRGWGSSQEMALLILPKERRTVCKERNETISFIPWTRTIILSGSIFTFQAGFFFFSFFLLFLSPLFISLSFFYKTSLRMFLG